MKNIQIIVADDGSTDGTGKIVKKFGTFDNRIVYVKGKHGGPGSARNLGIEAADADYYAFVDADDFVKKDFIEVLVNEAEAKKADIVCCSATVLKQHGSKLIKQYTDNVTETPVEYDLSRRVLPKAEFEHIYTLNPQILGLTFFN